MEMELSDIRPSDGSAYDFVLKLSMESFSWVLCAVHVYDMSVVNNPHRKLFCIGSTLFLKWNNGDTKLLLYLDEERRSLKVADFYFKDVFDSYITAPYHVIL